MIERADTTMLPNRTRKFPPHWGPEPFDLEKRAGWIAGNVAADELRAGRPSHVRPLPPHVTPRATLDPRLALLALRSRQPPPWATP